MPELALETCLVAPQTRARRLAVLLVEVGQDARSSLPVRCFHSFRLGAELLLKMAVVIGHWIMIPRPNGSP